MIESSEVGRKATFPLEPILTLKNNIYYRHYRITEHALNRYLQRIGGDAGNLINDLEQGWLLKPQQKGMPRNISNSVEKCEKVGGYALSNGDAVFLIAPKCGRHIVITTLQYRKAGGEAGCEE